MSSLIWYIYDFARKAWVDGFANARSKHEIMEKPERFRDFPKINLSFVLLWSLYCIMSITKCY